MAAEIHRTWTPKELAERLAPSLTVDPWTPPMIGEQDIVAARKQMDD